MSTNHVKVIAGYYNTEEKEEGKQKKSVRIFTPKREVVVQAKDLAALFRRDHELCGMAIQLQDTNERLTPGYTFSDR